MPYDRDYLISLMETAASYRAETRKSSLTARTFVGYANDKEGFVRIDAKYSIFPQYISIEEITLTHGFKRLTERYTDFLINKDSDLGEYMLH